MAIYHLVFVLFPTNILLVVYVKLLKRDAIRRKRRVIMLFPRYFYILILIYLVNSDTALFINCVLNWSPRLWQPPKTAYCIFNVKVNKKAVTARAMYQPLTMTYSEKSFITRHFYGSFKRMDCSRLSQSTQLPFIVKKCPFPES